MPWSGGRRGPYRRRRRRRRPGCPYLLPSAAGAAAALLEEGKKARMAIGLAHLTSTKKEGRNVRLAAHHYVRPKIERERASGRRWCFFLRIPLPSLPYFLFIGHHLMMEKAGERASERPRQMPRRRRPPFPYMFVASTYAPFCRHIFRYCFPLRAGARAAFTQLASSSSSLARSLVPYRNLTSRGAAVERRGRTDGRTDGLHYAIPE